MRILVVANPIAGRGRCGVLLPLLARRMESAGASVEVAETGAPGDGARLAREADGFDRLVAVGGDGTLREVAEGLLAREDARPSFGVVPFGTSNSVARSLRLPRKPLEAATVAASAHTRRIDTAIAAGPNAANGPGVAGGRRFLLCAGAGFDAAVIEAVHARRTGGIGFSTYYGPAIRAFFTYRFSPMRVTCDGAGLSERAGQVIVANASVYGGVFRMLPDARLDDGLLDVAAYEGRSALSYIGPALRGLLHMRPSRRMRLARARRVQISPADGEGNVPVHLDGDIGPPLPIAIEIAPASLEIAVPEAGGG